MDRHSINHIAAFENCYIMKREDIKSFADTLADGFSQYNLFNYACGKRYSHSKMSLFWAVSIALNADNAICVADSKEVNSVLVYVRPNSKDPGVIDYLKSGGLKMIWRVGMRSSLKLLRFDITAQRVAKRYRTENDGYLLCFATRIDKQGQHYGKHLMEALLRYLDMSGEGCYLETLKPTNVGLYNRFSYELKEQMPLKWGDLTLYAMYRPKNKDLIQSQTNV